MYNFDKEIEKTYNCEKKRKILLFVWGLTFKMQKVKIKINK